MLVTPSNSTRTVRPATAVTNHMKVRRREKAGRSRRIAFHQIPHSDSGSPRSGMVASMVQVGSGHPIGTIDSQFVNHVWAHDPDATRRAALWESGATRGAIQSDALTLRIFRDMAGFDHGGLLEISLRVRYRDGYRRETEREFQGPLKELPITPRR